MASTSGNKTLLHQANNFANMSANRVDCRNLPGISGLTNYGVINNYGPVTIKLNPGQNGYQAMQSGAVMSFHGNFQGQVRYPTISRQQNLSAQQINNHGPYLNAPTKKVPELTNRKNQRLNDYR